MKAKIMIFLVVVLFVYLFVCDKKEQTKQNEQNEQNEQTIIKSKPKIVKATVLEPDYPSLFCIIRKNSDPFQDDIIVYIKEVRVQDGKNYYSYTYTVNSPAWSSGSEWLIIGDAIKVSCDNIKNHEGIK